MGNRSPSPCYVPPPSIATFLSRNQHRDSLRRWLKIAGLVGLYRFAWNWNADFFNSISLAPWIAQPYIPTEQAHCQVHRIFFPWRYTKHTHSLKKYPVGFAFRTVTRPVQKIVHDCGIAIFPPWWEYRPQKTWRAGEIGTKPNRDINYVSAVFSANVIAKLATNNPSTPI